MDLSRFTIVAGQEAHDKYEAAMKAELANKQDLCTVQRRQGGQGLLTVEICSSLYGWSVRYGSGLQNFELLASCRAGNIDGTRTAAIEYATQWVARDPQNRYAFIRKSDEDLDERYPYGKKS